MAKVKVKVNFQISEVTAAQIVNQDLADEVGAQIIADMKDAMSKGLSPVEGERRYQRYKNPDKYPGTRKNRSPVNLFLTGKLYDALAWRKNGSKVEIGITDPEVAVYAQAHNEGTDKLPKRQFIPGPNESFLVSTIRKVLAIYRSRMSDIIKSSNK